MNIYAAFALSITRRIEKLPDSSRLINISPCYVCVSSGAKTRP